MLLGGDEFRRTQRGNNNAYCQDNEISWYDWRFLNENREIFEFTRGMIAFRLAHPVLSEEGFYTSAQVQWFSAQGGLPNWGNSQEKQLACLIHESQERAIFLMFNAGMDAVDFKLPPAKPGTGWHVAVDTSAETGQEGSSAYRLSARSSAILISDLKI